MGTSAKGPLEGLRLVAAEDVHRQFGPREVRIGMRAAGLNFRDVLIALGMYPGEAPCSVPRAPASWSRSAPRCRRLAVGDRVMGLLARRFRSGGGGGRADAGADAGGWSFAQAAAVPVVFLTAYYASGGSGRSAGR